MAKKLVKKGIISKSPASDNSRELILTLTDLGRKACEAHEKFHEQHMREVVNKLKAFSAEQISTTNVLLNMFEHVADSRLGS